MQTIRIPVSPGQVNHKLPSTILCFSHLRWDFVFQRPQQILTRLAKRFAVYYIEEPVFHDEPLLPYMQTTRNADITVLVPHVSRQADASTNVRPLIDDWLKLHGIGAFIAWYYTPMALEFSRHLRPDMVVYDCMDELSAFKFAPPSLLGLEVELLTLADIVFTGGKSLFNTKKGRHANVHLFPSSIDQQHFGKAKEIIEAPVDQQDIPAPLLGFFGVIDERFDIELIAEVARQRPAWQFVLIGPVVKIDPGALPRGSNIHYLGSKSYEELPQYLAGWDIAMIPFALNESTRFISPTKTPEYLAAGVPVISTPILDVVDPYGKEGLVRIAGDSSEFIRAAEELFGRGKDEDWENKVAVHLSLSSWNKTVEEMTKQLESVKAVISN